jgi:hypothetical protein
MKSNKATATATLATATVTPSPAYVLESMGEASKRKQAEAEASKAEAEASEAKAKQARTFKFRKLEIDSADLVKIALDGQSATGLVRVAYEKAGFPFTETLLESQSDGVTTLNKAISTAKKLVKEHGLSASAANNWLAYKQLELAFRFARAIGKL